MTARCRRLASLLLLPLVVGPSACLAQQEPDFEERRRRMVEEHLRSRDIRDTLVLEAMAEVPRHRFVPEGWAVRAYEDRPLPIGREQTISQPYIVALMTQLARVRPADRVLEVGTGSGYQAAVLAEIGARVYTIEIVGELARTARRRLERLGYEGVEVRHGDGYRGWPEAAPFDAVIVTAAPEEMPDALVEQLAPGGRLVAPVGPVGGVQRLTVVEKSPDGETTTRSVAPVRFVPMVRDTAPR